MQCQIDCSSTANIEVTTTSKHDIQQSNKHYWIPSHKSRHFSILPVYKIAR